MTCDTVALAHIRLGLKRCVEGGNFVGDFVVSQAVVACCVHKVGSRRGLERG